MSQSTHSLRHHSRSRALSDTCHSRSAGLSDRCHGPSGGDLDGGVDRSVGRRWCPAPGRWLGEAGEPSGRRRRGVRERGAHDVGRKCFERGQATAEYALVLVGVGAVAMALLAWASETNRIGSLLDTIVKSLEGLVT